MDAIRSSVPGEHRITTLLDLGCGTGRFSEALGELFRCQVLGVDPSAAMLQQARGSDDRNVEWRRGSAEQIPLEDQTVDLVFMSQVFHHLEEPELALREIRRVLTTNGYLVIRNATHENNEAIPWLSCFPEAQAIERKRILRSSQLIRLVDQQGFALAAHRTIQQTFASSSREYVDKIAQRGLSSLILIDDRAFLAGLERLRGWAERQPAGVPLAEPVDLFTFRKVGAPEA